MPGDNYNEIQNNGDNREIGDSLAAGYTLAYSEL